MKTQHWDAVVLGSGVAGLGVAAALARRGLDVAVVDKKGLRGQSSPAAAGILDPYLNTSTPFPLLDLNLEALKRFPKWLAGLTRRTRMDVGYERLGMFSLALNRADLAELKKIYAWQKRFAVPVALVSREQVLMREPEVTGRTLAGVFYPGMARVHPVKLVRALRRDAALAGARFLQAGDMHLETRGRRVEGLRNGKLCLKSPIVVNATGAWAGTGTSLGPRLPILPARGQLLVVRANLKIASIIHSLTGDYIVPWSLRPKGAGARDYLLGTTLELSQFRPEVTAVGLARIRRKTAALVPRLRSARTVQSWAGLRPYSKKGRPLIGATRTRGFYLATGFFRSGILMGSYAGELLAEGIVSGKIPQPLQPFRPEGL